MENKTALSNSLFWKIALTFFLVLMLIGIAYAYITVNSSQKYFNEVNQRLNADIAAHTVKEVSPNLVHGVDTSAIQDIMHSMMVINPSVEVYLLNPEGGIITYVAPYKKVKMEKVNLNPIKAFLENKNTEKTVTGDDPRNPGGQKVFSAAPVIQDEKLTGYIYIILASEDRESIASTLLNSYVLNFGLRSFLITLAGAFLLGLLSIWLITRNLNSIINTFRRFKEGDLKARINIEEKNNDLQELGTTFNEMADTIVANIDELKKVGALRRELTANVSHDLRTPLSIIQGYTETILMMKDKLQPEEQEKYLNLILSSAEKMGRLVEQLFEYSKLEARQVTAKKETFFIQELAFDVIQKHQILASKKNITLKLDAAENLPLVFADISLVDRVFQNLLDNALHFTPEGGTVTLSLTAGAESVEIKISDTGPGIPKEVQQYIFERYRKARKEGSSKGAGLGLAIVQRIMELHDTKIHIQSQPASGASFFFQLPVYGLNT